MITTIGMYYYYYATTTTMITKGSKVALRWMCALCI